MKNAVILLLVCLLIATLPFAGYSQTTTIKKQGNAVVYQDKFGNKTGSATKSGNKTTFRDSNDNITGTSVSSGNTVTIRDSKGKHISTVTKPKK
ncbi:MAG: hypothetical protein ABFD75_05325 [Smithella sp.]